MRNGWPIISGIAAIIAVCLTIFNFFHTESGKKKSLEMTLISRANLVNEQLGNNRSKLEVRYDGRPIRNYSLLQLRVENVGRQSISKEDYSEHLKFSLKGISEIVSCDRSDSDPNDLPLVFSVTNSSVVVSDILLNPTDWYSIEIGVIPEMGKTPEIQSIFARISGIKNIVFHSQIKSSSPDRAKELIPILTALLSLLAVLPIIVRLIFFISRSTTDIKLTGIKLTDRMKKMEREIDRARNR
ncbi:MAG: hypothetical protein WCS73_12530 [Lentisphaeria bacterium]